MFAEGAGGCSKFIGGREELYSILPKFQVGHEGFSFDSEISNFNFKTLLIFHSIMYKIKITM